MSAIAWDDADITQYLDDVSALSAVAPDLGQALLDDVLGPIIDGLKRALDGAIRSIGDKLKGPLDELNEFVRGLTSSIISGVSSALNSVYHAVENAITSLRVSLSSAVERLLSFLAGIRDAIGAAVNTIVNTVIREVGAFVLALRQGIKYIVETVVDKVGEIVRLINQKIDELIMGVVRTTENVIAGVRELITPTLAKIQQEIAQVITFFTTLPQRVSTFIETVVRPRVDEALSTVERIYREVDKGVREVIVQILTIANEVIAVAQRLSEYLFAGDYRGLVDFIGKSALGGLAGPFITAVKGVLYAIQYVHQEVATQFIPMQYAASKSSIASMGLEAIDLQSAAIAVRLGFIGLEKYREIAQKQGIPEDEAMALMGSTTALLPGGAIDAAYLRGLIDDDAYARAYRERGFRDSDISLAKSLLQSVPPPTDLIRMAVREVFNESLSKQLSLYEEFPEDFERFAAMQGISRDWAMRYWAAHWDLPSPTQGYEMLHRGIIDERELSDLLKALDYAPVWRDRLMALSYAPLTRVDIRRMYQAGVLTREEVVQAYRNIGYDETNAQRLTEFTTRYYTPEDDSEATELRRASRDTYLSAYRRGHIDRELARAGLSSLRYHPDDITLMLDMTEAQRASDGSAIDAADVRRRAYQTAEKALAGQIISPDDYVRVVSDLGVGETIARQMIEVLRTEDEHQLRSAEIELIAKRYVVGIWDADRASAALSQLEIEPERTAYLMRAWDVARLTRVRTMERSDLDRLFKAGYITPDEYADELRNIGYAEKYVQWYSLLVGARHNEQAG